MKKRVELILALAIVSLPNLSMYKQAVNAISNMTTVGIKIETGYKPNVPPASEVYDPENPIYGGMDYNY